MEFEATAILALTPNTTPSIDKDPETKIYQIHEIFTELMRKKKVQHSNLCNLSAYNQPATPSWSTPMRNPPIITPQQAIALHDVLWSRIKYTKTYKVKQNKVIK